MDDGASRDHTMLKARNTCHCKQILLVCILLAFGIFQFVVELPNRFGISNTISYKNPSSPSGSETLLTIKEGCVQHPAGAEHLSPRTHIPRQLEDAYLVLDEHLDKHSPLSGRRWQDLRPEGVAAVYLDGVKVNFLYNAIQKHVPNCRTVCEVGINAGHSSVLWLTACPDATVILFDMPYKSWSQATYDFLRTTYGRRVEITEGDSLNTIPGFIERHPDWQCDVIAIDGSKDPAVRYQDLEHFKQVAHAQTLLLLDDASFEVMTAHPQRNLTLAMQTTGQLNELYSALFLNGYLQFEDACSMSTTRNVHENSTISAHFNLL